MNVQFVWCLILLLKISKSRQEAPSCEGLSEDEVHLLPDEDDCSKYWECYKGKAYSYKCQDGLKFNPNNGMCDFPSTFDCDAVTATGPTTVPPTTLPECTADETGFNIYPYEGNCSKFWECKNGVLVEYQCQAPLEFNPETRMCDFPSNFDCEWRETPNA